MEFIIFVLLLALVVYLIWLNLTDHSSRKKTILLDGELITIPSKYDKDSISDENAVTLSIILFLVIMLVLMLT